MEIFEFKDAKTVPDKIHDYTADIRDGAVPIVIDNGSCMSRVGWSINKEPLLQFKNLIAKPRRERSKKDTVEITQAPQLQIGNDILNIEALRFQLKTQFDKNIVTHFEAQEHLFDYTFAHLGINTENKVAHPILCTEPLMNPNSSRQLMSELMFECYDIPGVCYGIDSLFSHHYHDKRLRKVPPKDALIVHLGYQVCHVIPVLDNKTIFANIRRLNTGGYHVITFLHRLLQLKYPAHATSITISRVEELLHSQCKVAKDYKEELNRWADNDYYEQNIKRIQLPYSASVQTSAVTLEQQKERKKELARRLTEINARKREERLADDTEKMGQLLEIKDYVEQGGSDYDTVEKLLLEHEIKDFQELDKHIVHLNAKIEKTRQKILSASNVDDTDEIPAKQMKCSKIKFETDKERQMFLQNARKIKQEILTKKMLRKQRKQDMAKRRTAAGQERMRIISQLARKEKGNDDFGLRDEDWDIYKTISKDGGDSDSEAENEKLLECEDILRSYGGAVDSIETLHPGEHHQLHFGVEKLRGPELLFKPYMMGSSEAGLSEVIAYVISLFDPDTQLKLASNVVVTGGLANLEGLRDRILVDLIPVRPFQSTVNVSIVKEPTLSAWYGARNFARSEEFRKSLFTKQMYQEMGPDYFKIHMASNPYYPTPAPTILEPESTPQF